MFKYEVGCPYLFYHFHHTVFFICTIRIHWVFWMFIIIRTLGKKYSVELMGLLIFFTEY